MVQRISVSVILMRIKSNMILNRGYNLDQPQIDGAALSRQLSII